MSTRHRAVLVTALAAAVGWMGCSEEATTPTAPQGGELSSVSAKQAGSGGGNATADNEALKGLMTELNAELADRGADMRVAHAEWVGRLGGEAAGQTVFANDRGNKQLGAHFVPGDARRGGGNAITYVVDQSDGATASGLTAAETGGAIDRAMATWDEAPNCSGALDIQKVEDPGFDPDILDGLLGVGGFGTPVADVTHAGWLPAGILGPNTLGVTFTFVFTGADGQPTDVDGNGKSDVAFREIYYNDAFDWGIDVPLGAGIDVETVALHEAGHGLSQAHFGKVFVTEANGKAHFAPFAVMNALISRQAQQLEGTDRGGHCSIWGSWPSN